jgi:hypothetical protein
LQAVSQLWTAFCSMSAQIQLDWINILAFLILATVVVTLVAMAASFVAGKMRGIRLARQLRNQKDSRA